MRMNDQQETSMRRQEALAGHVDDAAAQASLGEKAIECTSEIELPPFLGDALEHRFHLARLVRRPAA